MILLLLLSKFVESYQYLSILECVDVNIFSSVVSFKIGKGFQKSVSSGGLYVSIVSFVSGGGKSKGDNSLRNFQIWIN